MKMKLALLIAFVLLVGLLMWGISPRRQISNNSPTQRSGQNSPALSRLKSPSLASTSPMTLDQVFNIQVPYDPDLSKEERATAVKRKMASIENVPDKCKGDTVAVMGKVNPCEPLIWAFSEDKTQFLYSYDDWATESATQVAVLNMAQAKPIFFAADVADVYISPNKRKFVTPCENTKTHTLLCVYDFETGKKLIYTYPSGALPYIVSGGFLTDREYNITWRSNEVVEYGTYVYKEPENCGDPCFGEYHKVTANQVKLSEFR